MECQRTCSAVQHNYKAVVVVVVVVVVAVPFFVESEHPSSCASGRL